MDCANSCPIGEAPVDDSIFQMIGGMSKKTVIIGIVFGGIGVLTVLIGTILFRSNVDKGR